MPSKILIALCYGISSLILAFSAGWFTLCAVNFSYGFWHDHTSIVGAIEKYGPQNRYKKGFELTSKHERERMFGEIVQAVRHHGEGLADITFQVPGQPVQTLLREPEIIHLQDVAKLIDISPLLVVPALGLWVVLLGYFYRRARRPPLLRSQALGLAMGLAVVVVLLVVIGPQKVFNQLHIWTFPPDHQWFFYYQESLMSTMMYAPVLFAWIALEWTLVALLWYGIIQLVAQKLLFRFPRKLPA